jgi:hypothetical protein
MTPWVENIIFIVFKSKLLHSLPKHPKIMNLLACMNMKTKNQRIGKIRVEKKKEEIVKLTFELVFHHDSTIANSPLKAKWFPNLIELLVGHLVQRPKCGTP